VANRKLSPERASQIARMGKAKSPWGKEAFCCTPRAQQAFNKGKRLHLIAAIAKKNQEKKDD
jgi:hypothetical protein